MTDHERAVLLAALAWWMDMPVGMGDKHEALADAMGKLENEIALLAAGTDPELIKAYFAPHGCTPYYCPASKSIECCPAHSGWDTCCGRPDLHQPTYPKADIL